MNFVLILVLMSGHMHHTNKSSFGVGGVVLQEFNSYQACELVAKTTIKLYEKTVKDSTSRSRGTFHNFKCVQI